MRWYIVRPLQGVAKQRIAVWDQSRGESLQILANAGVGVFANDERGAGVVDEDVADPPLDSSRPHDPLHVIGDLKRAAAWGLDPKTLRVRHDSTDPRILPKPNDDPVRLSLRDTRKRMHATTKSQIIGDS